jgi:hypothetical protein
MVLPSNPKAQTFVSSPTFEEWAGVPSQTPDPLLCKKKNPSLLLAPAIDAHLRQARLSPLKNNELQENFDKRDNL